MSFPTVGMRASLVALALAAAGCGKAPPVAPVIGDALKAVSAVPSPDAEACAGCHPAEVEAWRSSQHANANRLVDPAVDGLRFAFALSTAHGAYTTTMRKERSGDLTFAAVGPDGTAVHRAEAVIGVAPLIQYLVPFPGGRLQAIDAAFDTVSNEWFYVFGDERAPREWGHWKNRAMNWNSQCAYCHTTGFEKRYDPAEDRYASTWQAMGISCAQCHVVSNQLSVVSNQCPKVQPSAPTDHRSLITDHSPMDTCASCHARREELTGAFKAGDRFDDHFRLVLADAPQFHPDGQVNDEDFEYGSFVLSRMHLKGVTCLDCHDPHSGRTKLPVEQNGLCMQCHAAPGQRGATVIDPAAHSRHDVANAGFLCVNCHMPQNPFMVRDLRRDHGFTSPDPLLTKELGIPNACNGCHADKPVDWAIEWTDRWYGTNMERRARSRARASARARDADPLVVSNLLRLAATEEIDAWRAALAVLLAPWAQRRDVRDALVTSLQDASPLVRAATARSLQGTAGAYDRLKPLRRDPVRLVRLDATHATLNQMERDPVSHAEFTAYLAAISDQPAGALRQAQFALAEGRAADAERWARKAVAWDPTSAEPHSFLGQLLHFAGKASEAEAELLQACALAPDAAGPPYTLALFYAERGRTADAGRQLQTAVRLEPNFGRAWYNLGLAYAAQERLDDAREALARAEALLPDAADAPYALATVLARAGDAGAARAAAQRALAIAPDYAAARALLNALPTTR